LSTYGFLQSGKILFLKIVFEDICLLSHKGQQTDILLKTCYIVKDCPDF
jgi:hypothetical protein